MLLERLIASSNGKCNTIRGFSYEELNRATNNYDEKQVTTSKWLYQFYEGKEQGRPILVKKFSDNRTLCDYIFTDIVFASQMSVCKNCLKLLGCCLETKNPILVFEYAENGNLADHIYGSKKALLKPLLWTHRLKIAIEIADALAYLHAGFPMPIVFRNLDPSVILLDENYVAKLSDFSQAVSIPKGETHVPANFEQAFGYNTSDNMTLTYVSEKVDIYSFGLCLLVLLTGKKTLDDTRKAYEKHLVSYVKKYVEKSMLDHIVDPLLLDQGSWLGKEQQIQSFIAVAFKMHLKIRRG